MLKREISFVTRLGFQFKDFGLIHTVLFQWMLLGNCAIQQITFARMPSVINQNLIYSVDLKRLTEMFLWSIIYGCMNWVLRNPNETAQKKLIMVGFS